MLHFILDSLSNITARDFLLKKSPDVQQMKYLREFNETSSWIQFCSKIKSKCVLASLDCPFETRVRSYETH